MGGRGYFCITNFFDKFRDLLNFFFAQPSIDWMFLFFFYDVKKYHRVARKKRTRIYDVIILVCTHVFIIYFYLFCYFDLLNK